MRDSRTHPGCTYVRLAATGDGVTDDTAAIQAVFAAAAAARRPVFCRSGTYVVTASLKLGTDFIGSPSLGSAACVIKYVGRGPAVVVTTNPRLRCATWCSTWPRMPTPARVAC